jgi:hypothetical protein
MEKAIKSLEDKLNGFIGFSKDPITTAEARGFKSGLMWAIDTLKTIKYQEDEFAIDFAKWCIKKRIDFFDSTEIGETYTINGFISRYKMSELLEIYKKDKEL